MHRTTLFAAAVATLLAAPTAFAEPHAAVAPGGGIPALDVRVDLAAQSVDANGARTEIKLERSQLPRQEDVVLEPIAIGQDRHVIHVRVPASGVAGGVAWEAIFAGGKAQPIFAGLTGLTSGDPGERYGKAVQVVAYGATNFVLVGDVREDLNLCGQRQTLFDPMALYPGSLDLRPATVQRLSAEQQQGAQPIAAAMQETPSAAPPLAKLLVARGSSVPGSRGTELVDGDPTTVWYEKRPGQGQGEFVVMAAPKDVPIARMRVVVAPPGPRVTNAAVPKSFYVVTATETFEVTMPQDAAIKPGAYYDIVFPHPLEASCVAVVLDAANAPGVAHPQVGIAEIAAYSEFDVPGATLSDVAKKLSSDRGIAAAQLLERAGDGALAAVAAAYDGLEKRGRALAIDVAAAHERCDEAAPLLARGLCNGAGEAPRKAREKLERCKDAAPVLAKSLREDPSSRACVAPTLAAIAPDSALEPIADAIASTAEDDHDVRVALRGALAAALKEVAPGRISALLADAARSATARLEVMRAADARISEAPAESETTVAELLKGTPSFRTRYLVLGPLEQLARSGDHAAAARLRDAITRDADWPVRARAAEAAAGVAEAHVALVAAARDSEPRVREAALLSLTTTPSPDAVQAAEAALPGDGWSFVRVQAVAVLGKAPASVDVDHSLGSVLHDRSVAVRGSAIVALARHHAAAWHDAIKERLDDMDEDSEVRSAAASALGAVCDSGSLDRLTTLARELGQPGASDDDQQVALGALVGLAALQPRDLKDRIAPLLSANSPPSVRAAAQQALTARGACR